MSETTKCPICWGRIKYSNHYEHSCIDRYKAAIEDIRKFLQMKPHTPIAEVVRRLPRKERIKTDD